MFKFEKNVDYFIAGETLIDAGELGACMYVVQDGELEVVYNGTVLETVGPGGIVGEMSLIDHSPRSASVIAKSDCRVVPIDEEKFLSYVHRTPFFALQVLRITVERLRLRMADRDKAG
jgi:CRP-like cAMP-binding protein